jgi:hypothetical protein
MICVNCDENVTEVDEGGFMIHDDSQSCVCSRGFVYFPTSAEVTT